MESHLGRRVALSFSVVMVASSVWAAAAAGATPPDGPRGKGDAEEHATRGPKSTEPSCSSDESAMPAGDVGRQRAAAPVPPGTSSHNGSDDCPDSERSRSDANSDETRSPAGSYGGRGSDSPWARGGGYGRSGSGTNPRPQSSPSPARSGVRSAPGPSSDAANGNPAPGSDDNAAAGPGDAGATGSSPSGSDGGDGGSATGGTPSARAGGGAATGNRRAGTGASQNNAPRRNGAPTTGGNPGTSGGGPRGPGVRFAPANPARAQSDGGDGMPKIKWASLRAPGIARAATPESRTPAAALPSTAAAVLAVTDTSTERAAAGAPAGPLARTGGEPSASAVLALMLILAGTLLRRSGRRTGAAAAS